MGKKSSRGIVYEFKKGQNSSKVIIFLHALALNKSIMKDIISFFFQHNYSTLNIELRGHGNSSKKNCKKKIYINECISDVLEILAFEKINEAIIIGHSLGAVIASCLVSKYPEKFKKLIICAPLFRSPLKDQIINVSFIKIFILIITYLNCYISRFIYNKKYLILDKLPLKTRVLFFRGLSTCSPLGISNISNILYSNNFDISNELNEINISTLIIGGKNDFLVNGKILNKINKLIKDSILRVYKGNHCIIYKKNRIWFDIIKFLNNDFKIYET